MVRDDGVEWEFVPFVGVGPLRFGSSPEGVRAALVGAPSYASSPGSWIAFEVYFGPGLGLCAVAVDARRGPKSG
ncbi:hypothetical protein [Embleya hyalina]|uniref:hypothetical protein n=1 Tax=Embleya hyalina TaxID=516124 RepID=UPI000F84B1AA|nr:hypothetical protein [Embleya hyalina]